MRRRLSIVLAGLFGIALLCVIAAWLVLRVPFFSDLRRSIVEEILSEEIGQQLIIRNDVLVSLAPISRLHVSGVEIPSENLPDVMLAELNMLELDLDLIALINGSLNFDNLTVDQLQVNLIRHLDDTTSWTANDNLFEDKPGTQKDFGVDDETGILTFLQDKTVSFSKIGLLIENEKNGFVFEFDLNKLDLQQLEDGQLVALTGGGTVNGEPFDIDGQFPRGKEFVTRATFGELRLDIEGVPLPAEQGGGFTAGVSLDTGEFGEVLDILRLNRVLEGRGHLSATVLRQASITRISDFETDIQLADGEAFTATGGVESLLDLEGFDLSVNARLYPENQPPAQAHELGDLKLTGINAHIVSEDGYLKFANLEFETNAFDQELSQLGPVSVGRIMRTPEGHLSMRDIKIQVGPINDPYIRASGDLENLLQLQGLELEGELVAPATLVLPPSDYRNAASFGRVQARFAIDDAAGHLTLSKLKAFTKDTDLWSLNAQMKLADVGSLEGIDFNVDLDVPVARAFLEALDLTPVDLGAFQFMAGLNGDGNDFSFTTSLAAGGSRLDGTFESTIVQGAPLVHGLLSSDLLRLADLQKAVATTVQLTSLGPKNQKPADLKEEPLVMQKDEEPLVIPKEEEPLVIGTGGAPSSDEIKLLDLLNPVDMMRKLDMDVAIDIRKIEGQKGVSSVVSDLVVKDAQASFGPLDFRYGGGSFNVNAGMNLRETPNLVTVSGTTGGWDLGEILQTAGVDLDAHGKLTARFNLTGSRKSARRFINSMSGSVTASMYGGTIATSLLELAGLGVFPWLFSAELNKGYTNIVCAVAPLRIQSGRVSSNSIVVETNRVQMVVAGSLDWRKDTIAMRAEPRPVGRPLARSAWPINITGSLTKPDINLQAGGSRPKRQTGNNAQMPTKRTPCKPDLRQIQ